MTGATSLYGLPYLTTSDRVHQLPAFTKQLAEKVEGLMRARNVAPMASSTAAILQRLNALEAAQLKPVTAGMSALNGYTADSSTRLYSMGDLTLLVANLTRAGGATAVPLLQLPAAYAPPSALTFAGIASVGGAAQPVTLVAYTNGQVRSWTNGSPNTTVSFNIFWKRGQ